MNNGLVLACETQEASVGVVVQGVEELNLSNSQWRRSLGKGLQGFAISVRSGQAQGLFWIQRLREVGKNGPLSAPSPPALMPCIELHTNGRSAEGRFSAWAAALSACSCEAKRGPQETPPPLPIDQRDMISKTREGLLLLGCLVSLILWKSLGPSGEP